MMEQLGHRTRTQELEGTPSRLPRPREYQDMNDVLILAGFSGPVDRMRPTENPYQEQPRTPTRLPRHREYQDLNDASTLAGFIDPVDRMRAIENPHRVQPRTPSRLPRRRSSHSTEPQVPTIPEPSPPRSEIAQELTCSICLDLFRKPVLLQCGHSFCRICIDTLCKNKAVCPCPVCRAAFQKGKYTGVVALHSLAEKVRDSPMRSRRKESIDPRQQCRDHREKLKLFCKDDGCLACLVCREAPKHKGHSFLPIQDAVSVLKDDLRASLLPLKETLGKTMRQKINQEQVLLNQKREMFISKNSIASLFRKFYHVLIARETKMLKEAYFQVETAQKEMDHLMQECHVVRETLQTAQNQLDEDDPIEFMTGIQSCLGKFSKVSSPLFHLRSRGPIEYTIWKQLKSSLCPAPTRLTLDPDTAHYDLVISDDQTSVWYSGTNRWPPPHCKRFIGTPAVMTSEGFTSGKHYWEVDVGRTSSWVLGVAEECINREAKLKPVPWEGVWVMEWKKFESLMSLDAAETHSDILPAISRRQKIGLYLDFDSAVLSFYNAADMSHVQTIRFLTRSKLFPYFCLCADGTREKAEALTLRC